MPTYGPVPASFKGLSHHHQVLFLYRHILRQGASFFDERASHWIRERAQETFRKNKSQKDEYRVQKYTSDARKALRLIERANQMDLKSVMRILRLSHGLQGKDRRILLQPFVDSTRARTLSTDKLSAAIIASGSSTPSPTTTPLASSGTIRDLTTQHRLSEVLLASKEDPEPLFFKKKRTVPPILSPPLVSLIQSATGKSVQPILPQPLFKPLHGKREANLRWRFFTKQMGKVKPPLAGEIRHEIERKSRIGLPRSSTRPTDDDNVETLERVQEQIEWEQRIMTTIKAWNKTGEEQKRNRWEAGRFHPSIGGKPAKSNTLTLRLYRRIWQQLLNEVPILDVKLSAPGPSELENKDAQEGALKDARLERSLPHTPASTAYLVSKSAQSHQARSSAGLKLQALVNDFDQLGFSETSQPPRVKPKKKATSA
ncbi:hypothetical protein EC957_000724 [Mortierella hygrophila]|uniref:LYR motif-containing protein Cup1-like N-terminal domain-containing protein n=1 Tax=Mortierella hygrophila TaxID=979708 RepID=A0A9P6FGM5_9FUNG|nr:hypothetical protein EC957_000724 [Mortierella hygrophila]